jgi:hypothetical protein
MEMLIHGSFQFGQFSKDAIGQLRPRAFEHSLVGSALRAFTNLASLPEPAATLKPRILYEVSGSRQGS